MDLTFACRNSIRTEQGSRACGYKNSVSPKRKGDQVKCSGCGRKTLVPKDPQKAQRQLVAA